MEVKIATSFAADFKILNDNTLTKKIKSVLAIIKTAENIKEIAQLRKINGNDKAYKVGIGFYYIVAILTSEKEMTLLRFLHRDTLIKVIHRK